MGLGDLGLLLTCLGQVMLSLLDHSLYKMEEGARAPL